MNISTKEIKKSARSALTGRWVQPMWLLLTTYLLTQLVGMLLGSTLSSTSFFYFLFLMLLNYFVLFAFEYGQYYYPMSVFGKQPFKLSMLFVAFSPYFYKRFVVLNFIKSIFLTIGSIILFIPFIGKMGWSSLLQFVFGSYSVDLVDRLVKVLTNFSTLSWTFFFGALLIFFLITLFVDGFFQVTSYLVFENGQNPNAHILVSSFFLMKNHWVDLLKLQLSFIVWYLFYPVTFLWLIPYRQMAIFVFYMNLKQDFASKMGIFTEQFKKANEAYTKENQNDDDTDSEDGD